MKKEKNPPKNERRLNECQTVWRTKTAGRQELSPSLSSPESGFNRWITTCRLWYKRQIKIRFFKTPEHEIIRCCDKNVPLTEFGNNKTGWWFSKYGMQYTGGT